MFSAIEIEPEKIAVVLRLTIDENVVGTVMVILSLV